MPKRRRLLTPMKKKTSQNKSDIEDKKNATPNSPKKEVSTARGRLKGALLEALEPAGEESDASIEPSPSIRNRYTNHDSKWDDESEEERLRRRRSPARQSYVLKLFDRSVDLSQFKEDSPLYPICRAWIANQPKADYSKFGRKNKEPESLEDSVELPGPEGPPVSRIPELLPEQKASSVDNINLNYEGVLPSREQLLQSLAPRWAGVRGAWLRQAARGEQRYQRAQLLLNKINANDTQIIPNKTEFSYSSSDNDHIHRVRCFPSILDDNATQTQTPEPYIDVRSIKRQKSEVLAEVRARCGLDTADLNMENPARPIFENEHLTPLYSQARKLGRENGFAYIWIKDCNVFVKKSRASKPILIESESDLVKMK